MAESAAPRGTSPPTDGEIALAAFQDQLDRLASTVRTQQTTIGLLLRRVEVLESERRHNGDAARPGAPD